VIRYVALLALLAGCGRWRFDENAREDGALPDVVTGHDEDRDGLPDVTDPCPATAGDTADTDGDGVGDACDPDPAAPNETITVFEPFTSPSTLFESLINWTEVDDGIRTSIDGGLTMMHAGGTMRVEIGFEIHGLTSTPQHQVACGLVGSTPFYFVELNENGPPSNTRLGLIAYDATNGYVGVAQVPHPGMHAGRGILQVDGNVTTREFRSTGGWIGEMYSVNGPTPAYDGATGVRWSMNGLDITVEYVMFIETN